MSEQKAHFGKSVLIYTSRGANCLGSLRFSFVNVAARGGMSQNGSRVNTGRAPILASSFSDVFNVYSAKKFPGVCESTPLSKAFAAQGIKIPIRKDANLKGGDGEDDYGD